ncbi:MAG: AraC family transcriptional regulator [Proteobacteria bacterium]|nr:MAG: AraC family transcriptional regulator [Pseudomonadota bacterium]
MDALSRALGLIKPQTYISSGISAKTPWSIHISAYRGIKLNTIVEGSCLLKIDGDDTVHELKTGDCFLLTSGRPFILASDLQTPSMDFQDLLKKKDQGVIRVNGGGDYFCIGARFDFPSEATDFLFKNLPPLINIPQTSEQSSVLRFSLEQFIEEFRSDHQGRELVLEHLLQFMLVHTFRAYMNADPQRTGWLGALGDKNLSRALGLIQNDLKKNWKVEELAENLGMSRSTFALKFKDCLGFSPIDYARNLKMLVAQQKLIHSEDSIAQIAESLGYESESSFRLAFKRVTLVPPARFRRQ